MVIRIKNIYFACTFYFMAWLKEVVLNTVLLVLY